MKLSRVSLNPMLTTNDEDDSTRQCRSAPVTAAFLCPPCTSPVLLFAPELPEPSSTGPHGLKTGVQSSLEDFVTFFVTGTLFV